MEPDEWLDIVDKHDVVMGRTLRSVARALPEGYFRAINLFIRNNRGELWIPRRTAQKELFPLGLDFSCAGHVQSGHTYEDTLKKEVDEELNINIGDFDIQVLGKSIPESGIRFFAMNYEIRSDEAPNYNPDDFIEYFWLTPQAVVDRIEQGEYAKTSLAPHIRRFYLNAANGA